MNADEEFADAIKSASDAVNRARANGVTLSDIEIQYAKDAAKTIARRIFLEIKPALPEVFRREKPSSKLSKS